MRELVSVHNITKDTDIGALLDVLMEEQEEFLADNAEAIAMDVPEGDDHAPEQDGMEPKNLSGEGEAR